MFIIWLLKVKVLSFLSGKRTSVAYAYASTLELTNGAGGVIKRIKNSAIACLCSEFYLLVAATFIKVII